MCYTSLCLAFKRLAAALWSSALLKSFIGRLVCKYLLPASQNRLLIEHNIFTVKCTVIMRLTFRDSGCYCKEWLYRGQEHVAALRSIPRKSLANYMFALYICYTSLPTNTGLLKGLENLRTEPNLLKNTVIYCTFRTVRGRGATN